MVDIKVKVMSAYKEYTDNGYPEDPDVYTIRANTNTVKFLKDIRVEYAMKLPSHIKGTESDRFLSFRLVEDGAVSDGEIIFGPEVIVIKLEI